MRPARTACAPGRARAPQGVDHGDRAAAHRGDVAEVDHYPAPAGKARVVRDEGVEEPLDGKQQVAVAVGNRRAIVAVRHSADLEPPDDGRDVGLVREATAGTDRLGQSGEIEAHVRKILKPLGAGA